MDSRSLDFAAQIGDGVDVVLNSLGGEFIPKSLGVLRANGRFIEIGKSGILTSEQIALLPRGIRYTAFDLGELAMTDPAQFHALLESTMELFTSGELTPLPRKDFCTADAGAAFRFMAQARHLGKIVISMGQRAMAPVAQSAPPAEHTEFLTDWPKRRRRIAANCSPAVYASWQSE